MDVGIGCFLSAWAKPDEPIGAVLELTLPPIPTRVAHHLSDSNSPASVLKIIMLNATLLHEKR